MIRYALIFVCCVVAPAAQALPLDSFALYGGDSTGIGNNVQVNGGYTGAGAVVALKSNVDTVGILGGGPLSAGSNSLANTTGNIVSSGNVTIVDNGYVTGDIDTAGNVIIGANAIVKGSIRAGGSIQVHVNAIINGNVDSGAASGTAVTLADNSKVIGTITRNASASASFAFTSSYGGSQTGTPTVPSAFTNPSFPGATPLSTASGGFSPLANFTTNLLPGTYGDLNLGVNNVLNLFSGKYFFNTWTFGDNGIINFDLTAGPIALFFTGNVSLGYNLNVNLIGGTAKDIYAETLGDWLMADNVKWQGTIEGTGPTSDITLGDNNVLYGAAYARDDIRVGDNTIVNYVGLRVPTAVPEPGTPMLLLIALLAFAALRVERVIEKRSIQSLKV